MAAVAAVFGRMLALPDALGSIVRLLRDSGVAPAGRVSQAGEDGEQRRTGELGEGVDTAMQGAVFMSKVAA